MFLELADYRLRVAELYAQVRDEAVPILERHARFVEARDELFKTHPQSPLSSEQKEAFVGLSYYPYDPDYRFELEPELNVEPETFEIPLRDDGAVRIRRVATVTLPLKTPAETLTNLSLFWVTGYGGGLFLPFRDATNEGETYGGGRYLLDTIKHADLGQREGRLVLDFNFAYHPSCAYNPKWDCPLAPFENKLSAPIVAGEKL